MWIEICCFDIFIADCFGEMIVKDFALKLRPLAVKDVRPAHPLGSKIEATDTAKKRAVSHCLIFFVESVTYHLHPTVYVKSQLYWFIFHHHVCGTFLFIDDFSVC